jgi:hypothetical protein
MNQPGNKIVNEVTAREVKRDLWIMLVTLIVGTSILAAAAGYFGTAGSWFRRAGIVFLILGSLSVFFLGSTILCSRLGSRLRRGSRATMVIGGVIGMFSGLILWFFIVLRPMMLYVL